MKEIMLIAICGGLIIFFVFAFGDRKKKKNDKKVPKKETEKIKEDIPEIVKEVTMGNFMYDVLQSETDGIDMLENENIGEEKTNTNTNIDNSIEKAYDEIDDIGEDFDLLEDELSEIDEYGDAILYDVDEEFNDDVLLGNMSEDLEENNTNRSNNISDEYKGLSKEIKIMLVANILKKKK